MKPARKQDPAREWMVEFASTHARTSLAQPLPIIISSFLSQPAGPHVGGYSPEAQETAWLSFGSRSESPEESVSVKPLPPAQL